MKSNDCKRVLIADDDPGIRTALRATLEADGYKVVTADDGRAAIEALLNQPFDVAVLDLSMPRLDGLEVLREFELLRGSMTSPAMMVLTAYDSVTAAVDAAGHGAVEFLHKPITPDSLCAAVGRAVACTVDQPVVDCVEHYFG